MCRESQRSTYMHGHAQIIRYHKCVTVHLCMGLSQLQSLHVVVALVATMS